jgi:prepilin-type N-terminal cleavage/methylation domain-containing protein
MRPLMRLNCVKGEFTRSRRFGTGRDRRRAFTLMELVVTLSIIAVVTLLAAPSIRVDAVEADAAVHRVRSAFQHAQRLALVQQHPVLVSFDITKQRVRIVEDKNADSYLNSGERFTWRPLETGNSFAPPNRRLNGLSPGTKWWFASAVLVRNGMPTVMFRRDGSLSTDLELYLKSARRGRDSRRAITVSMATGRVEWFKYLGGTNWRRGG